MQSSGHFVSLTSFNTKVCHVTKITVPESNPDMEFSSTTLYISPDVLARHNKMPAMTTTAKPSRDEEQGGRAGHS